MAVKRFLLDTSTLDDSTTGLDGFSPAFTLDSSNLDGNGLLDGADFLTVATGTATLGALTATSSATITHPATGTATLGALTATSSATITHPATASADLGGLAAAASATVINPVTATATLGGLAATATATVTFVAVATATLGSLTAVATATITPQPSPEPTPSGGGRQYAAPRRRKPVEPTIQPVEPTVEPKRVSGVASVGLGSLTARAQTSITFSILEDDAELLLML